MRQKLLITVAVVSGQDYWQLIDGTLRRID